MGAGKTCQSRGMVPVVLASRKGEHPCTEKGVAELTPGRGKGRTAVRRYAADRRRPVQPPPHVSSERSRYWTLEEA